MDSAVHSPWPSLSKVGNSFKDFFLLFKWDTVVHIAFFTILAHCGMKFQISILKKMKKILVNTFIWKISFHFLTFNHQKDYLVNLVWKIYGSRNGREFTIKKMWKP